MFLENQPIGPYILIKQIGRGGFGEVWLAERRTEILTTRAAIKLPHREQIDLEAIRREAELWARASGHANILPIIEANIYDGQIVIVSEYAPDGSLEEKIRGEMPVKQTLETVTGILNGLDFLHSRHIIHRDIKPANILLQGETPRLADFGISRVIKTTALSASIIGTPKYMAPETFDGKRTVQTDIWSVGVVLYRMLCGSVPFPQENPTELMYAIVFREPGQMPKPVSPDLHKIVNKALAKQPENRFQSAREMRDALQKALLAVSHPTFAPTEALNRKQLNNQTTEDKSILLRQPLSPLPPTEKAAVKIPQNKPVIVPLEPKTVDQNQPKQANILTEYNPILPTIAAKDARYQAQPPAFLEAANKTGRTPASGVQWLFYFFAPVIGALTMIITSKLGWGIMKFLPASIQGDEAASLVQMPLTLLAFGIVGISFGYVFPRAGWKWGLLLNILILILSINEVKALLYLKDPQRAFIVILLFSISLGSSCLASYSGSRLSTKKSASDLSEPPQK